MTGSRLTKRCLLLSTWIASGLVWADESKTVLRHNPFSKPESALEQAVEPAPEPAADARPSSLVLSATLVAGSRPLVNVEGEIVEVGEEFGGFRLESVGVGTAVFVRDGNRHTFEVGAEGLEKE